MLVDHGFLQTDVQSKTASQKYQECGWQAFGTVIKTLYPRRQRVMGQVAGLSLTVGDNWGMNQGMDYLSMILTAALPSSIL